MRLKTILKVDNSQRSKLLQKNVFISVGLTGINALISFLMYPLLIDYLGVSQYGVWLTIASLSTWMTFFEFGLGSGLKNQLARSLARTDYKEGKQLVSTAYFAISVIVVVLFVLLFLLKDTINWNVLLGTEELSSSVLSTFASVMISSFFMVFILKLLGNVASASQNPYIEKTINSAIQVTLLVVVVLIGRFYDGDIVRLSLYWSCATVSVWVVASIILYTTTYKKVRPSVGSIKPKKLKSLMSLGIKFFVIQISLVVIHGSTNFLISRYVGADEVVVYNAAYKIFNMANIMYSIIIAPTWVAFVDALEKKDIVWVKSTINRMLKIWMLITLVMFVVLILSPYIYDLWLGERIVVPFGLSALLFVYFSTMTFGGVFNMFVNATGNLRKQLICWFVVAVLYIPLTTILLKYSTLGVYAVAIGLVLSNVYYIAIAPFDYKKMIKKYESIN